MYDNPPGVSCYNDIVKIVHSVSKSEEKHFTTYSCGRLRAGQSKTNTTLYHRIG